MKIHGVRIYPDSVEVVQGEGAPIFVHGAVSEECSDFFYIFGPVAELWRGHFFVKDFAVSGDGSNPMRALRKEFGPSLVAADRNSQLMLLRGDDFGSWGASMYFVEGALLPIFREPPVFELVNGLFWSRDFRLTSETWPEGVRALMHMWDDMYWQLFSTQRADIEALIRRHAGDPKLKMYFVDFDREYPNPSNGELELAMLPG